MKNSRRVICTALLWLFMIPSLGAAQRTQADSLKALVETLLTGFLFADARPTLRLAALPTRIPHIPLPAGAEVFGSLEYPNLSMTLIKSGAPADLVDQLRNSLEKSGWSYKPAHVAAGFSFTPAGNSALLCSDNASLSIGARQDQYVSILHSAHPMTFAAQCLERQAGVPEGRAQSPLPPLDPPAGATSNGTGRSAGGDFWDFRTRLRAELSPKQLLDHYVRTLRLAGADIGVERVMDTVAFVPFMIKDSKDVVWRATMTVVATGSDHRSVYIQLLR